MLDFKFCPTTIEAQKIDDFFIKIFGIIIASFKVLDKLGRACIFQKTFLLANIIVKVVFTILILIFNNANI